MHQVPSGFCAFAIAALCWTLGSAAGVAADEPDERYVEAPPNHAVLANTLSGWYFAPKEFKEQYDGAMKELESLQVNIDAGNIRAADAQDRLEELKKRLHELRQKIQSSRVLVKGAEVHQQSETIEFEPGVENRLVITANHVRIVGWDGAKVKAELKKMVLSPDGKPVAEHLKAIKVVHEHAPAAFAGKTDAEWEAEEREFMAGEGAKLSEEARARRQAFIDDIRQSYAIHRDYVGKTVDQLSIAGLEYENNASITIGAKSPGGDGQFSSTRQRYAELTVYVPELKSICVRGARRGLVIENVKASLTIVDEASTDSDARGRFEVMGLTGDLHSKDFPLQKIVDVDGQVTVDMMADFGIEGAGTLHHDDIRDMTPGRPAVFQVHRVTQAARLNLGRVRLDLQNIGGQINVTNEFGDTTFHADGPLANEAHRIVSQSGRIEVLLDKAAWSSIPVIAVTNHGGVRTNLPREQFEDFYIVGSDKSTGWRRNWQGFRATQPDEDRFAAIGLTDRFSAALENQQRSAGLDLISRSGRIVVLRSAAAD